jgi:hypothetical protein
MPYIAEDMQAGILSTGKCSLPEWLTLCAVSSADTHIIVFYNPLLIFG